jgi:glycine betaine/proline transport system ATP-binding protein
MPSDTSSLATTSQRAPADSADGALAEADGAPVVRVRGLSKAFGRHPRQAVDLRRSGVSKADVERSTGATVAVLDVTFDVRRGETFVVIGLSGSGKSTLLRLLNRLIDPTNGDVLIDGSPVAGMNGRQLRELRRRKVGMVFQHFGLLQNRTVMDNVTFGLEIQKVPRAERRSRGEEALELVGLAGQGGRRVGELSGGMQQRVGLARALATGQEILLMDEPFSALDPLIRREMQNLFLVIEAEVARTVIFITHDLDEALRLGHRVAIMRDGEIVQVGTPEEILREPADAYVRRFIEDVDATRIRCAEAAMIPVGEIAFAGEGPRVVLRRLRKAGLSMVFVLDEERDLLGRAEITTIAALVDAGAPDISSAVGRIEPVVDRSAYLRDVVSAMASHGTPVAVVDGRRLVGVITRGSLISALTRTREESGQPVDSLTILSGVPSATGAEHAR